VALTELIESAPGLDLVGMASDADQAATLAVASRPDVALLDVRMPAGGGLRAARLIRQQAPGTRMVAFSAYSDRTTVMDMLRAGAVEYLVKGLQDDRLIDALRRSGRGVISLPLAELEELVIELAQTLERSEALLEEERANLVAFTGDLCARLGDAVASSEAALVAARHAASPDAVVAGIEDCMRVARQVITELAAVAVSSIPDETGMAVER